jgi:hypothetical protein
MMSCLLALLFIFIPNSVERWRSCFTVKVELGRISASDEDEDHKTHKSSRTFTLSERMGGIPERL